MQHLRFHGGEPPAPASESFRSPRWPRREARWTRPALRYHGFDDDPITHVEKAMAQAEQRAENLRALMREFGLTGSDGSRAA